MFYINVESGLNNEEAYGQKRVTVRDDDNVDWSLAEVVAVFLKVKRNGHILKIWGNSNETWVEERKLKKNFRFPTWILGWINGSVICWDRKPWMRIRFEGEDKLSSQAFKWRCQGVKLEFRFGTQNKDLSYIFGYIRSPWYMDSNWCFGHRWEHLEKKHCIVFRRKGV